MSSSRRGRSSRKSASVPHSSPDPMGATSQAVVQSVIPEVPEEPVVIAVEDEEHSPLATAASTRPSTPVARPAEVTDLPKDGMIVVHALIYECIYFMFTESNASQNECIEPSTPTGPAEKPDSLTAAIKATRHAVAASLAKGSPLIPFLTPPGRTGVPLVDEAMDDLRASRYCLWMGNPHQIAENCTWQAAGRSNTSTLRWKSDAPSKPVGSEGDAIIGFIGMVSTDGSTLSPDAGWQVSIPYYWHIVMRAYTDTSV
jgi:hypothetical protein